jgi:3-deoxy-manno-octulosonate cytidylyltransferase (CMP-KDO synthetase)
LQSRAPFLATGVALTSQSVLGVVPARLGSERLPRKPLHPLAGRPLIEWVWRRIERFGVLDACVVATDAEEILEACVGFGARAVMTSPAHRSGTDRVAEVAALPEFRDYGVLVNVQGDEPLVTEEQVGGAVSQVRAGFDVGTVAAPVRTGAAWRDPAVVKVARRPDGAALYFSRAAIPHKRDGEPTAAELSSSLYLRHVGVYAYGRSALERWVRLAPSELEEAERLEQLRALSAGLTIGVGLVAQAEGGVDTAEDAARAERRLLGDREESTSTITER